MTEQEGVEEFYITFGSQYSPRNVQHPQGMLANGFFVIEAPDEITARHVALAIFDTRWSMLYTREEFFNEQDMDEDNIDKWYPVGELGRYKLMGTNLKGPDDGDE